MSPDRAVGQVQYQCPADGCQKDVEPDGNGGDYRNEGNGDGPTLVGLQLITRAGVEHEMAQARTKMLKKRPGKANHDNVAGDGCRQANELVISRLSARSGQQPPDRSEEQPSELQSLMRLPYAASCLKNTTN